MSNVNAKKLGAIVYGCARKQSFEELYSSMTQDFP